jgi:hypothetical protein
MAPKHPARGYKGGFLLKLEVIIDLAPFTKYSLKKKTLTSYKKFPVTDSG